MTAAVPMALAVAGAAIAVTALLFALANLAAYRRTDPRAPRRPGLLVSVCIPARNEAANIGPCVRSALASDHCDVEVLVYDDESDDDTRRIVAGIAAADLRCHLVATRALPPGWNGKQHACAAMAAQARGAWLLFTDADVRLAPDAVRRALDFALHESVALASTFPRQQLGSVGESLQVPMMFFLLLSYLPFGLMRRTGLPSAGAGCGQFLLVERTAYVASGGHGAFPDSMHDGIQLPRSLRAHGFRTDLFDGADLAAVRMYRGFRDAWHGFAKNAYEGLGSPAALAGTTALHVVGHVLPWLLLPLALAGAVDHAVAWPAGIAVAAAACERILLAVRFAHPVWLALAHPATVALMVAVQWRSWFLAMVGARSWRGRRAPASTPAPARRPASERVVLVDAEDRELGSEEKLRAHEDGGRLHRAFSVFVFDSHGRTLLQRRADAKYHFGGLWTNSCCGHPRPGETVTGAAARRLREEMGITVALEAVGSFIYRASDASSGLTEHELDHVCVGFYDGDVRPDPAEAGGWRWVTPGELDAALAREPAAYTPWLPLAWREARARVAAEEP